MISIEEFLSHYTSKLLISNNNTEIYLLKSKKNDDILIMKKVNKYVNDNQLLSRKLLNKAIDNNETNNFIYTHFIFPSEKETIFIQDYVSFTLNDLLNKFAFNDDKMMRVLQVIIIRTLLACITMRKKHILHSDLHINNIMIGDKPSLNGYYEYVIFKKKILVPSTFISVKISDFEQSQVFTKDNTLINNLDFFKTYFSLMYLSERNNFHELSPNKNIYYVDPWFFFKSLISILQNHPHKSIELILNILLEALDFFENKISKIFKKKEDNLKTYANNLINIINKINFTLETTGLNNEKKLNSYTL